MNRFIPTVILALALVATPILAGGEQGDVELGVFAGYAFPDDYTQSVPLNPDDDQLFGARLGYFATPTLSLELSAQRFESQTTLVPGPGVTDVDFDIDSVRLNLFHNFRPGQSFRPFFTLGAGLEKSEAPGKLDSNDPGYNVGLGFRWFLGQAFSFRFDTRYVMTDVGGTDGKQRHPEASLGASLTFGGKPPADTDGDGVVDRKDRCPATPRGAVVDASGCPVDTDVDGVADGLDRCAGTPAGVPVDASGCPKDSDGDGVHDGDDRCAGTPRGAKVDSRGCPTDADGDGVADGLDRCADTPRGAKVDARGCPLDADGDRVYDGLDTCPGTPAGAKVDRQGCPTDTDGDGVYDGLDKCPGTPKGTKVDVKGCKALFEEQRKTLVLEGVNFEFNSATLTAAAEKTLDRVALSLKEWSDIRVEVGGHTDSVGNDAYNQTLSTRRAESVRKYLIDRGVSASRVTAKGYGESRPAADNATKEGRRKNRRVELRKLN